MEKMRVLIVDDSAVARRVIAKTLQDSDLEIAGIAPHGRIALAMLRDLRPDIVTLDLEMPEMDGLETLTAIRQDHPRLPVIVVSALTERGGVATLEALSRGASDYITKPEGFQSPGTSLDRFQTELLAKIKALFPKPVPASPPTLAPGGGVSTRVDVVAIAVSTGGPQALARLFSRLPDPFPAPILIVQHMPPLFTRLFAEWLASQCRFPVAQARADVPLAANQVVIAPGDFHLEIAASDGVLRTRLGREAPENSCRPSADVLFRSAAAACGRHTLAVVLTGMGQDGLRGCEAIRRAGGHVIAQDEASSVVWGMPGFVARAALADAVLPIDDMAGEIARRAAVGRCP